MHAHLVQKIWSVARANYVSIRTASLEIVAKPVIAQAGKFVAKIDAMDAW